MKTLSECSGCGDPLVRQSFAGEPGTDDRFCAKCYNKAKDEVKKK